MDADSDRTAQIGNEGEQSEANPADAHFTSSNDGEKSVPNPNCPPSALSGNDSTGSENRPIDIKEIPVPSSTTETDFGLHAQKDIISTITPDQPSVQSGVEATMSVPTAPPKSYASEPKPEDSSQSTSEPHVPQVAGSPTTASLPSGSAGSSSVPVVEAQVEPRIVFVPPSSFLGEEHLPTASDISLLTSELQSVRWMSDDRRNVGNIQAPSRPARNERHPLLHLEPDAPSNQPNIHMARCCGNMGLFLLTVLVIATSFGIALFSFFDVWIFLFGVLALILIATVLGVLIIQQYLYRDCCR